MFSTSATASDWLVDDHDFYNSEPSPQDLANQNFSLNYADRYHLVHVLKGSENPLKVAVLDQENNKGIIVQMKRFSDTDYAFFWEKTFEFDTAEEFADWLRNEEIIVPQAFVENIKVLDGMGKLWEPELRDFNESDDPFVACFRLSYEMADASPNQVRCSRIEDAIDVLSKSGALYNISGNSSKVTWGTLELFSASFQSNGFDQGDSHINPKMVETEHPLLAQLKQDREFKP